MTFSVKRDTSARRKHGRAKSASIKAKKRTTEGKRECIEKDREKKRGVVYFKGEKVLAEGRW